MARKPVLLQFTEDLLEDLDRLTAAQGRSRSAVVRDAVERYVLQESGAAKESQMAEAYRRIPDGAELDGWGARAAAELVEEEPW